MIWVYPEHALHSTPNYTACIARVSIYITRTASNGVGFIIRSRSLSLTQRSICLMGSKVHNVSHTLNHRDDLLTGGSIRQDHSPLAAEDLVKLGVESRLIPFVVSTTLRAEQSLDGVPSLSPAEARDLVEILDKVRLHPQIPVPRAKMPGDQVVSSTTVNPSLKNRCFKVLRRASPSHAVLPKSHYLDGVTLSDTIPYASGGFADIWKGQHNGNQMCVKAFRTQTAENLARIKRVCVGIPVRGWAQPDDDQQFYREIVAWKYVSHANVLPFLGVSETLFAFCIISPWLSNGNIIEYTKRKQGVNRLQLVSYPCIIMDEPFETSSSTACASCQWPRILTLTKYRPQRYQSGEY